MAHRVLGTLAAVLFGAFVIGGCIVLASTLPQRTESCASYSLPSGATGWTISAYANNGEYFGSYEGCFATYPNGTSSNGVGAPVVETSHTGTIWNYVRLGIGAWIAWTLGMFLIALAVAYIPQRPATPTPTPPAGEAAAPPLDLMASPASDQRPADMAVVA